MPVPIPPKSIPATIAMGTRFMQLSIPRSGCYTTYHMGPTRFSSTISLIAGALLVALLVPSLVLAAKPRVRQRVATKASSSAAYSSVRLSTTTRSVVLTLLNLDRVRKVTYTLSYTANGIQQGVVGSITPSGQKTDTRDLYFGTCSKGVCTPHYTISNATLTVTTTITSGATTTKRYRIKTRW